MACHHGCCETPDFCVRGVPLFDSLTDEDVALLHETIESKRYTKGESVFREGEPSDSLYIVNEGVVKVSKLSDSGKEHILRLLFPGDFLGQFALFKEGLHYADAEAMEESVVCRIHRTALKAILERNPQMSYRFLAAISQRLREADEWVEAISLQDVERRLAKTLLIFEGKSETDGVFQLPVPKKDFAALLGATPETLSRKLSAFESQSLIRLHGKKGIQILDPTGLEIIAGLIGTR